MRAPTKLQVYSRYLLFLLWEFRWPLGVFWGLVFVGGFLLKAGYQRPLTYPEACYTVFLLIFLESGNLEFPREWYLQLAFFLLPIIGLGAVADSVVRLGYLIFASKQKLPEWQHMVASLHRNHVVVVGVGKLGVRIVKELLELGEPVVAIERNAEGPFVEELHDLQVPVITGDGRLNKTLELAGVRHARAVIAATNDDLTNLDAALTALDLNPKARVIMRLFDDTLAAKVGGAFRLPAISPAQVSAPAFIAAATGRKVYHSFQLGGQEVSLVDVVVSPTGRLAGRTVGEIQADKGVNIVMHQGPSGVNVNPGHDIALKPGDSLLVIAPKGRLIELEQANQPRDATAQGSSASPHAAGS
jgi:Trk K+ transport system NAD-binding subunit